MSEATPAAATQDADTTKNFNFPLVVHTDMNEEMVAECTESAQTAVEKHSKSNEAAARMLKETMDKKFGPAWHVVVGEGFGFEMTHESKHLMYMFFGGNLAILVWKCS